MERTACRIHMDANRPVDPVLNRHLALAAVLEADAELDYAAERCLEEGNDALAYALQDALQLVRDAMRESGLFVGEPEADDERGSAISGNAGVVPADRAGIHHEENPMGRRKKSANKSAVVVAGRSGPGTGKRGRKADPTETARRAAVLKRVNAGELSNNQAADELGLRLGTWSVWKGNYIRRTGAAKVPPRRGRPPGSKNVVKAMARRPGRPAKAVASTGALADLVAQLQSIERFQEGLRERLRELAEFVEANAPG